MKNFSKIFFIFILLFFSLFIGKELNSANCNITRILTPSVQKETVLIQTQYPDEHSIARSNAEENLVYSASDTLNNLPYFQKGKKSAFKYINNFIGYVSKFVVFNFQQFLILLGNEICTRAP